VISRSPRPLHPGGYAWGAVILATLAGVGLAAAAPPIRARGPGSDALVTMGAARTEIRFPAPVRYAVILREPEQGRLLFARGDILFHPKDLTLAWTVERVEAEALFVRRGPRGRPEPLRAGSLIPGFPGWRFTGTVLLEEMHYRYKVVERIQHPDPVLVALEASQAVLEVEVVRRASPPSQASSAPATAVPLESAAPAAPKTARRARATLDGGLLENIRVRELGPGL